MKKKRVAALVMAAILGVTGFSVPGIGVVQAEEAHTEMSGEAEQQEINLAADRGSTARASKFLAASGNLPAREPGLAFDGISDNNGEADNSRWQSGEDAEFSEQWLEVDLGGICVVSEIKVDCFARLYGDFRVEVSDSNAEDAVWTTIATADMPEGTDLNLKKTVDVKENGKAREIPRYIRLYFTSGNSQAANRSIGVREFQVIGTKKSESGYETITGNIALNKTASASGVEAAMPNLTANLAVDGQKSDTSRWSAPTMKNGTSPNQQQTPQWLEIDLRNEVTNITSIDLYFYKLVYSIDYEIQTRADKKSEWKTVKHVTCQPGNEQNKHDSITDVEGKRLDRYVRFYFNKVNTNAGGNSVSVQEIEIHGDQVQTPEVTDPAPKNAKEAMDSVKALEAITVDSETVPLPKMPDGFSISVKGSEYPQVISDEGQISDHNMYDYDMDVILEVVNENDPEDTAEKTFQVHVPNKKSKHAEIYPEIKNQNEEPEVIPSLQEWYGYEGEVKLTENSRIVLKDGAGVGLEKVASQFKSDMKEITGMELEVVSGEGGDEDDILIESLPEDTYDTGKEGYLLKADDGGIHISSNGYTGCLYGTKTLEQVYYTQDGTYSFPKGVTRDFSQYEVRGVMIDIARVPYRLDALKDIVKTFSFYKINEVHFHLNDNRHSGATTGREDYNNWKNYKGMFRLESKTFPSLKTDPQQNAYYNDENGAYGGEPQYTAEEYKDLQQFAMDCGMNPISEIDAPGHSLLFNRYVRNNIEEIRKVQGFENMPEDGIKSDRDWELLSVKGESGQWALKFLKALYSEYLNEADPVFLGDTVDIGVDEYWSIKNDEFDGMRNYIREMADTVQESGKKVRMWGSMKQYFDDKGISTKDYTDIEIDFWSNSWDNAAKRSAEGFKIVNVDSFHLYGNTGRDKRDVVNVEHIFNNWTPVTFSSSGTVQPADPNLLGAKTAMWADIADMGVTERDNYERLMRQAAVLSEKTWGGTDEDQTYEEYSLKFEKLKAGPGVELASDIPSETSLVLDYDFKNVKSGEDGTVVYDAAGNGYNGTVINADVKEEDGKNWLDLNGDGSLTTGLRSVDYPYTVQFDLKVDKKGDAQLFDGRDGRLSIGSDGKLKINRSYFEQKFDYTIPENKSVNVTIVGTQQVTKLYINGEFKQALTRTTNSETDYNHLLSTFVFPLTTIGNGFDGKIADLKVYDKALSPKTIKLAAEGKAVTEVNVAQDKAAAGTAQHKGDNNYDNANKKLRVGWKAIDGDGNTADGKHGTDVSEKDSFFEGLYADSSFAVDMLQTHQIDHLVLQWDKAPATFKLQVSSDGKVWKDIEGKASIKGESVNTIKFEQPLETRYIKMQGVDGTFQLREFEAYETVNKDHLKETLKAADDKLKEYGIQYGDEKYKEFFAAYMEAESAYENAYALNHNVSEKADALKAETEKLENLNPKPEPTPELKSVTVTAESKKLKVGEETTVTAKVDPTDAKDVTITWKTSDATVLKVDEAGKVTALKAGKATITATAVQGEKKVTDSVEIEVEEEVKPEPTPELKSVTVTAESKKLKVGEETTVTAKVDPTDAKDVTIIWTTSDETVLKVDEAGKVTALKVGKATITATAVQGEKKVTDSVEIEVEEEVKPEPTPELKSVTVTAESKKLKVGEETTVTAKVDPTDAKDVTIIWTTSDETVLKVDEAGKVTALKVGKATITATAVQGEKKVKVTDSVEIEVEEETATPTPNPDPQPTPEKNDGAVQTGDNVSPMLYAGAAMTAAAVLALIQRKRRKG